MAQKKISFNEAMAELEQILASIESGDLDVDDLSVKVKRSAELIDLCQKKLHETEEDVNKIFGDIGKKNQD